MPHQSKIGSWFARLLLGVIVAGPVWTDRSAQAEDAAAAPEGAAVVEIDPSVIPALPDGEGLAGAIAGRTGRFLLIAGGANFPNTPRWETDKVWYDSIQTLDLAAPGNGWKTLESRLDHPVAYGISVSHSTRGVISIGGDTGDGFTDKVFAMRLEGADLTLETLPALPERTAYGAGAIVGETIVVFGGQTESGGPAGAGGWRLDLAALGNDPATDWTPIAPVPTGGRILPVAASHRGAAYCFSGAALESDGAGGHRRIAPYLTEAWRYDLGTDSWTRLQDLPRAAVAAPSPAIAVGFDMLAVAGGDDGSLMTRVAELQDEHPGFDPSIQVYHPTTDRWTIRDAYPVDREARIAPPVTATTITIAGTETPFDGSTVIASGEIRPRTRTPRMAVVTTLAVPAALATLDWIAIAIYGAVLVWMGWWFSRREDSTEDFFLAGRRIPWWASGISIFATSLSAITFMAIPAKTWDTDWLYFPQNLLIVVVAPIAAMLLVPAFRRLDVTTAYEWLEHRFHWSLRLAASALYMLFQVGRVAVVTLLPALALAAVTGLDVTTCIVVMGVICILYTVLGGIEAVIWSDVLQAAVLFGGAVWALFIMIGGTDGGVFGLVADASAAGKLRVADISWDLTRPSLFVIVLGGIFSNVIPYASDQSVVQRYLAVKDVHEAKRAVWAGALLAIPASLLFFALGTGLWGFYRSNPESLHPTAQLDQILPLFIVEMLPAGVAGIVLAGLFAAAMSSLDSSMNSVATSFTTDWYRRFFPDADDRRRLRVARIATVTIGVVGTGAALLMVGLNDPSLLDVWFKVIGLFGSGVAGVFLLGAFTKRTGPIAGWCGLVTSAATVWSVGAYTQISGLAYSAVGILACLAVGLVVGLVDRRESKTVAA